VPFGFQLQQRAAHGDFGDTVCLGQIIHRRQAFARFEFARADSLSDVLGDLSIEVFAVGFPP
jgi:hypothetical protein